jgi:hypothetical protein
MAVILRPGDSNDLIRNPHIHYNDCPRFNGVTAVDRAVQIVATGSTGGP